MQPVLVIGGGGHAKVVIEILEEMAEFEVVGCITSDGDGLMVLDTPVLGDDSQLAGLHGSGIGNAFVAIGDNRLRSRLTNMVAEIGFTLVNAVSPRAILSRRAELSTGIAIMAGAVINSCTRLGSGCIVNTGATVDHDCTIGAWVHLAPGTNLAGCVNIGEGAFLGIGSRVIPDISIGAWTTVGAGAVVVRDLPANAKAVGVPARVLGVEP